MMLKKSIRALYNIYKGTAKKGHFERPRRYIPKALGVVGFFKELKSLNVNYAVLRWFENLPYIEPGEDIDILVHDDDLLRLDNLLCGVSFDDIACDIYTSGGLPGTDHRGVPYFPNYKALEVLDNAVYLNDLIRTPSPYYHFMTMAYHVVYHKGYNSDIPSKFRQETSTGNRDHPYDSILLELAERINISIPDMSIEALDAILETNGWKPEKDTLKKLSRKNQWIHDYLLQSTSSLQAFMSGMTVFIVREAGMPYLETIQKLLEYEGFETIEEVEISQDPKSPVVHSIRGGNWNKGPWPISGGLPSHAFLVYDYLPREPDASLEEKHPGITNAKIHTAKINIRNYINSLRKAGTECNTIHSADSADEALEYSKLLFPGRMDGFTEYIENRASLFQTPYPVIQDLTRHANRAKIEIVDYNGRQAICKTFKPGYERFLEREVLARKLGTGLNQISEILEAGSHHIILKKYTNSIDSVCRLKPLFQKEKLLPIWIIRIMVDTIVYYRSLGYEMIDFNPTNILLVGEKDLKIIDFEFMQKAVSPASFLRGNYAWYPIPASFDGDVPFNLRKKGVSPYKLRWQKRTGLTPLVCENINHIPTPLLFVMQVAYTVFISFWRMPGEFKTFTLGIKQTLRQYLRKMIKN